MSGNQARSSPAPRQQRHHYGEVTQSHEDNFLRPTPKGPPAEHWSRGNDDSDDDDMQPVRRRGASSSGMNSSPGVSRVAAPRPPTGVVFGDLQDLDSDSESDSQATLEEDRRARDGSVVNDSNGLRVAGGGGSRELVAPMRMERIVDARERAPLPPAVETTTESDPGLLRVVCVTWNLHGRPAPDSNDDMRAVLRLDSVNADIYAIATQECEQSIEKAIFISSKKRWEARLTEFLGPAYTLVSSDTLQAIHLAVFVRTSLSRDISYVQSDRVAAGPGLIIGTKGAVGISFSIGTTTFLFISAHLAAHQGKVKERNENYHHIQAEMKLHPPGSGGTNQGRYLTERFDRVFWLGDLNYRIDGRRDIIERAIREGLYDALEANDQLLAQRRAGVIFVDFNEGPLTFPPTYKFDVGTHTYDTSKKQRMPAWTDRILFKSSTTDGITLHGYDSVHAVTYSDHKPVYADMSVRYAADRTWVPARPVAQQGSRTCAVM